jgi:hypothetical protein
MAALPPPVIGCIEENGLKLRKIGRNVEWWDCMAERAGHGPQKRLATNIGRNRRSHIVSVILGRLEEMGLKNDWLQILAARVARTCLCDTLIASLYWSA